MSGVIVYGPQGCGKTTYADKMMQLLGLKGVKDDFMPGDTIKPDTLHLTNTLCNGFIELSDVIINEDSDQVGEFAINKSLPSLYVEFYPICTTELGKVVRVYVNSNGLIPLDLEAFASIFSSHKPLIISAMEFITIFEH